MHEPDMITAFNDCVERVLAGETVERCLQDYPTLAAVLRPMLETMLSVRRSAPPVPLAAKARVGARVMQQADHLGYVQRARRPALPRLTWAAAVLALVLFAGALSLWLRREPQNAAAPSPSVGVTAIATGTVGITPPPTATASLTATFTLTPSATASPSSTPSPTVTPTSSPTAEPCEFVITVASANLRSGPGTGYPVVGTASQGERFRVLARHISGTWYEIARPEPPAQVWVAAVVGQLEGACDELPVSDLSLLSGGGGGTGGTGGANGAFGGSGGSHGGDSWMLTSTPHMGDDGMPDDDMFDDDMFDDGEHDGDGHMPDH